MIACAIAIVRCILLSISKEAERGWSLAAVVCELPNNLLSDKYVAISNIAGYYA
jgi:hypothetical protein